MNISIQETIGLTAALLTTCSFMPQVYHSWKKQSAKSLSWGMLGISIIAAILWLSYGILLRNNVIILSNAIMGCLQLNLVYLKFIYQKKL
nr:SemiSWEET family transporter [Abyssalbus ytuae]